MAGTIRIGLLNDMADAPPGPGDVTDWIKQEIEEKRKNGRIHYDVELIHAYGLGLPDGSIDAVQRAFHALQEKGVHCIVGPAIGDNALAVTPWVESAQIPTINWAGAERARGNWMFHLQVGSHEDESLIIARHLHAVGCKTIGAVFDQSPIGTRHLDYLNEEAKILGLSVTSLPIEPLAQTARAQVAEIIGTGVDGMVYLGLGLSAPAVASALTAIKWNGPRIMNTAGLRGYQPEFSALCDEWIYIDMHSDTNSTLNALLKRKAIPKNQAVWAAKGYDLARLVAEGIARSPAPNAAGIREGLERIKWLPAAEGKEGTQLGFGIQDRGALHGRYLVLRQWLNGKSVEIPDITI